MQKKRHNLVLVLLLISMVLVACVVSLTNFDSEVISNELNAEKLSPKIEKSLISDVKDFFGKVFQKGSDSKISNDEVLLSPSYNGLIFHAPFNGPENSGLWDFSGNFNDLNKCITNPNLNCPAYTPDKNSIPNFATYYGGAGTYAPDSVSLDIGDDDDSITISAWVYPVSFSAGYSTIVWKGENFKGDGFDMINYYLQLNGDKLTFGYVDLSTFYEASSEYALPLNEWSFIAINHYGGDIGFPETTIYSADTSCNLVKEGPTVQPGIDIWDTFNDAPLFIGVTPDSSGPDPSSFTEIFDGRIDDIRIYNRELSEAEIQDLCNADLTKICSDNILDSSGVEPEICECGEDYICGPSGDTFWGCTGTVDCSQFDDNEENCNYMAGYGLCEWYDGAGGPSSCTSISDPSCSEFEDWMCENIESIGGGCNWVEGDNLNGETCEFQVPGSTGQLYCSDCYSYDTSGCIILPQVCGDGEVTGDEVCDIGIPSQMNFEVVSGGLVGTQSCNQNCNGYTPFEASNCYTETGQAGCDNVNIEWCVAVNLGDAVCTTLGWDLYCVGEALAGNPVLGNYPTYCDSVCGDGVITGIEECDGTNLDGTECVDIGYCGNNGVETINCNIINPGANTLETCENYFEYGCIWDGDSCEGSFNCADLDVDESDCDNTVHYFSDYCSYLNFETGDLACYVSGSPEECTFNTNGCYNLEESLQITYIGNVQDGTDLIINPEQGKNADIEISALLNEIGCSGNSVVAYLCDPAIKDSCSNLVYTYSVPLNFISEDVPNECVFEYTGEDYFPFYESPGTWRIYSESGLLNTQEDFTYTSLSAFSFPSSIDFGALSLQQWNTNLPSSEIYLVNQGNTPFQVEWSSDGFPCISPGCTDYWESSYLGEDRFQIDDDNLFQEEPASETGLMPEFITSNPSNFFPQNDLEVCISNTCNDERGERTRTIFNLKIPSLEAGDYEGEITLTIY